MKKKIVFFTIICLLIFFGMMGILIFINSIDEQTEETSKEYMATISKVESVTSGDDTYIEIYTKEYDTKLYISPGVCKMINNDEINHLQRNQVVIFRIENIWLEEFEESSFIEIISLKTLEKEIFSLSDYNECISDASFSARVMGIIVEMISFLAAVYCIFLYKRRLS